MAILGSLDLLHAVCLHVISQGKGGPRFRMISIARATSLPVGFLRMVRTCLVMNQELRITLRIPDLHMTEPGGEDRQETLQVLIVPIPVHQRGHYERVSPISNSE